MKNVRLGDVVEIQLGKMLSPESKTGLRPMPYLRNANVQWDRFDLTDIYQMDFDIREEQKFLLKPGDVLVCEGGEPGRAAVWNGEIHPCFYQKALHRLRPINASVDPRYLMYRLWLGAHRGEFLEGQAQTTIAHLPAIRLAELQVKIPPIHEQRRIAAELDHQLAAVASANSIATTRHQNARHLRDALLRSTFEGGEASRWPRTRLGKVCEFISDGTHQPPPFAADGVPFLFVRNIVGGRIDLETNKHVSVETYEELTRRRRPTRGDVLYSAVGSFGVAVVVETNRPFTFQRHIAHLRLRTDIALPEFVAAYVNSPAGRSQSESVAMGGAQRTVTLGALVSFDVPIPSIDEQRRIAAELRERLAAIDALEQSIESERDAIEALPAALLRRAFETLAV